MTLSDDFEQLRAQRIEQFGQPVPTTHQRVSKDRIAYVLSKIDRSTDDMIDAVFALLDDQTDSFFSKAPPGTKFCAGATTAQLGCHIGILQRGATKLDREGRDYWIKPLRELGAINQIYFDSKSKSWMPGHPKPKSPNSAYILDDEFKRLLMVDESNLDHSITVWAEESDIRERAQVQARAAEISKSRIDTEHRHLIDSCLELYVPRFLAGYEVVFIDLEDGDRITNGETVKLENAGLKLGLGDAMPDILLWNPSQDALWVIEAVTSDGEVDSIKQNELRKFAARNGKSKIGFTTAYPTWKTAGQRQGRHKNLAVGTYLWILEDPSKQFRIHQMMTSTTY